MEGFCKGCLRMYDDPMEMHQYTEKNRRLFVYSTSLQVKRNDTLTFQLCKDCFLNMKVSCKFKKQCRASDKKLKSYLALKDVGDGIDLNTFLADTMAFRLPGLSGSSTPAHLNKSREDDNESCTSIRNFMTDILQGEEMPDTEARIIREVIKEEADVSDDSLDSHWLQDDVSIDTDFKLDFSLSPFATPRGIDIDHCYTPKRYGETEEGHLRKYFTSISPSKQHKDGKDFTDIIKNNQTEIKLSKRGTKEVHSTINNFFTPTVDIKNIAIKKEKSTDDFDLASTEETSIIKFEFLKIEEEELKNNFNSQIVGEEKHKNNLDLQNLPSQYNERSINNLDSFINDHDKSFNSLDLPSFDSEKSINNLDLPSLRSFDNETSMNNLDLSTIDYNDSAEKVNAPNFYVPTDGTAYITTSKEIEKIIDDKISKKAKSYCTIDKNLEKALGNENNKEFALDELLVSPRVFNDASGASTPTITNILFGDKLNLNERNSHKYLEHVGKNGQANFTLSENAFQNTTIDDQKEVDIKHEFKVPMDVNDDIRSKRPKISNKLSSVFDETQFDLENFFCNICEKKFESSKALSIHFTKKHKINIIKKKNTNCILKPRICNFCGKEFNNRQSYHRHIKIHQKEKNPQVFKCERCKLEFTAKSKFEVHKRTHKGISVERGVGKYVCTECGATSTTIGNLRVHQRRHTKNYIHTCEACGKGFYRLSDYTAHMRSHTGEKPFQCLYCDRTFGRKDGLTKHTKYHIGDKQFRCEHCSNTYISRSQLNLHLKVSKRCKIKREIILDTPTQEETDDTAPNINKYQNTEINENVNHNEDVVISQLPYIDTEMSN